MPRKSSPTWTAPFTVAIDTREQQPYSFENIPPASYSRNKPIVVPTEYIGLPEGDYQIVDAPPRFVAVERKSLADLFSTLGQQRERFENEVQRLAEYHFAAIIIEASWPEICNPWSKWPLFRSRMHPRGIFETASSWSIKYPRVHWITSGNRRLAEIQTFSILQKAHKVLIERERGCEENGENDRP